MTKLRFKQLLFHDLKKKNWGRNDQISQKNFHGGSKRPKSDEMTGCRNDCHSTGTNHLAVVYIGDPHLLSRFSQT